MRLHTVTAAELLDLLAGPDAHDELASPEGGVVVVDLDGGEAPDDLDRLLDRAATLAAVVVGTGAEDELPLAPLVDVVVPKGDRSLDVVLANVEAHPRAATALALLLRGAERRTIGEGLQAESAVYSTLQAGPEFEAWRKSYTPRRRSAQDGPAVKVIRDGDRLDVVLNRPTVHNAFNTEIRDGLLEAFAVATLDPSIDPVVLRGEGPSFCSGGDLDEFGTFPDPATAHLVRVTRSVGRAIAGVSERVVAHLHGACMGSGIELPAFAGRVVARPDVRIALPEIGLGLIPGAGGTVSLPRRIGRHRTAWLGLTATPIDGTTALAWSLVDELDD